MLTSAANFVSFTLKFPPRIVTEASKVITGFDLMITAWPDLKAPMAMSKKARKYSA